MGTQHGRFPTSRPHSSHISTRRHFIFQQGLPQRLFIRERPDLFVWEGFEPPTLTMLTAMLVAPAYELPDKPGFDFF